MIWASFKKSALSFSEAPFRRVLIATLRGFVISGLGSVARPSYTSPKAPLPVRVPVNIKVSLGNSPGYRQAISYGNGVPLTNESGEFDLISFDLWKFFQFIISWKFNFIEWIRNLQPLDCVWILPQCVELRVSGINLTAFK